MTVYVVLIPNGMIMAAYIHEHHADMHARTVLGARVASLSVLNRLPPEVSDDIASDDWDNGDTPVVPESDITETNPSTPRSKSKSKAPT